MKFPKFVFSRYVYFKFLRTMKKILMSMTVVAAMFALASCACCIECEKKAEGCCEQKCDEAKCAACDKAAECTKKAGCEQKCCEQKCAEKEGCCEKKCEKQCEQQCEQKCADQK